MNSQIFTTISLLLILGVSPLGLAFASTSSSSGDDFLNIREATIDADSDEMSAFLETHDHIPTNGDGGAFGYGILTTEGINAVVVSTTHAGVLDSEEQSNADDPVWHNHFVTLEQNSYACGDDIKVESITFESPGQINIENSNADLRDIPASFSGTDAFTDNDLSIEPGTDVEDVVSFKLSPQFNDNDELETVCVTDLQSAENIVFDNDESNSNSNSNSNGNENNGNDNNGNDNNGNDNNGNDNDNVASQGIGQSQSTTQ